ncbi:Piwi domain-containing protein [Cokeromyces recurvatus]|uniref:Piwi domain-containing protein n=1 Tax=Cokeromyces recurvatus TaxID=90255 RepID=UPI00221EBD6F|nr:Piwi domain-containing protein [Cokeromyces recurvatus]KAI7905151.1 Piwi domain-containing protein [Cokeromyces recurvatus]
MSLKLTELVKRPGIGKSGKAVRVRANFFEVTSFPSQNIHHYDFTIDIPKTSLEFSRKVWNAFETTNANKIFGGAKAIFDGRKNVFSPKLLKLGESQAGQFEVQLPEISSKKNPKSNTVIICIKKVGEVNMEELNLFLKGKAACSNNCLMAIMVLDVLIRHVPLTIYTTVGRSFYTPNDKRSLPNGAEVWQGYYQSARPTVEKMMINLDVSATAFYEPGSLPEVITKILGRRSIDDFRRGMSVYDIKKLGKILKLLKIRVTHRGEHNRNYTICSLTPTSADQTKFVYDDGDEISVAAYFSQRYNKRLHYPFLPCVVVGKNSFFPMEVCVVVQGQRINKKLNEKQTAEMIKFTCQKPDVRANKIIHGFNLLQYKNNEYMQQFGMTIKPEMAIIKARVLPSPKIAYHVSSHEAEFIPQCGAWNLRGKKLTQGATLSSWSIVNFAGGIPVQAIQRFIREMCQTFAENGMNVTNRNPPVLSANPQGDIERSLKEAWLKAGNVAKSKPQVIFCILPSTITALYAEIKRVSDTVIGVPTQCLQSKHISEAKKQYCGNVSLKVNTKLGGMNWTLPPNYIPFLSQRPTIVIGADITHPSSRDSTQPSIAALAASIDARAVKYTSVISFQPSRTEIIDKLAIMMKDVLKKFYQACGQKPSRILFYRDGVSEGEFKQVMNSEVAAIHAACASLDKTYKPTLTFVVVQKRHHARFFPIEKRDADRTGNCLPGTVVDTNIVHPFEFDFYLQSHAGLQGTSRPTHYHVLYDENKFTADTLPELTYNLCYTFARATRAVSIVPAVYYADIIASRARFHRKGENWSDTDATSDVLDSESQIASYATVIPDLQKVAYFM